ncbi:GntR family transcriptional regulator [Hyphomicrobium sp. CS1GBMeth3]|uniref:GntR family transcriptional regulator n=1 Tax=Hyphomicrobium sp. CS1GBMeth3 TaxID=1892845 RepID=UPI001FCE1A23|nr:GntR family transcriptional regulator [Hyphomicrobium sp. CS1GBMeth3]
MAERSGRSRRRERDIESVTPARLSPAHRPTSADRSQIAVTTHESVYRGLRDRILFGGFLPGSAVTLRGLAEDLGVSPMPIREAVRRLIAERALKMQDNRRVLVPPMTSEAFEQIVFARKALEPELAARAMDHIGPAELRRIITHDKAVDRAMAAGDVHGYMENNFRFHFAIYKHAHADTLLALVESIWLQFGPFMRMAYNRWGTSDLEDQHQAAIAALERRDRKALRSAIAADVSQGMTFIGEIVLKRSQ